MTLTAKLNSLSSSTLVVDWRCCTIKSYYLLLYFRSRKTDYANAYYRKVDGIRHSESKYGMVVTKIIYLELLGINMYIYLDIVRYMTSPHRVREKHKALK